MSDCGGLELELGHDLEGLGPSLHNGPGWRIALWTQGCTVRCTDVCLSPHLLEAGGGRRYSVSQVVAAILSTARQTSLPVEGITVLGGEPSDQAAAVAAVAAAMRAANLSVMVYSGRPYSRLSADFLADVDILVDGPFMPDAYDESLPWRGSANQSMLLLSDRYGPDDLSAAWERQRKSFSIHSSRDGSLMVSGMQSRGAAQRIAAMIGRVELKIGKNGA